MRRKLVRQGTSTMMISLPSDWIKKQKLGKGDEIDITEEDNKLILNKGETKPAKKKTKITLTNETETSIRTIIQNACRTGYDIIEIRFNTEKQYTTIIHTLKDYLIGYDVVKKEANNCTIENLTEPSEEQFETLIKKIIYNVALMIENTEDRLKNKTKFEDYIDIDSKIKQYQNFCLRVIAKKGRKSPLFWTFLVIMIHGHREIYHLNRYLDKNKINFENFDFINEIKTMFKLLSEAYLNKDISKLEKIHELEKNLIYNDFYKLIQKNKKENIVLYHLTASARNFYLATSPLIGLLLESSISE